MGWVSKKTGRISKSEFGLSNVTKQIIMTCICWKIENGLEDKLQNDILNQLQIRKEIG